MYGVLGAGVGAREMLVWTSAAMFVSISRNHSDPTENQSISCWPPGLLRACSATASGGQVAALASSFLSFRKSGEDRQLTF